MIEPLATYYSLALGAFAVISDSDEDRIADALACAEDHAFRIARALVPYVSTNWQRASYSVNRTTPPDDMTPAASSALPCPSDSSVGSPADDAAASVVGFCDVRGCDCPARPYTVGGLRRLPVMLCEAHGAVVRRDACEVCDA